MIDFNGTAWGIPEGGYPDNSESSIEAAARAQSERIRPGAWDEQPESYKNWQRDEARTWLGVAYG